MEWMCYTFSIVIFLMAILFNTVILNMIVKKGLKTTTYQLIINQIVAELVFSVLAISRSIICNVYLVNRSPVFLAYGCGVLISVNDSTLYVSAFSMIAIAYERYRKIYRPMSSELRIRQWIVSIWSLAIGLSLFNNINRQNIIFFGTNLIYRCRVLFNTDITFFEKRYNYAVVFSVCCVGTLITTAYLYYRVIQKIRDRQLVGNTVIARRAETLIKNKRRTIDMLLGIVIWYVTVTTPYYLFIFYETFIKMVDPREDCRREESASIYKFLFIGFFYFGSLCVNPILICWYNHDFRNEIWRIFGLDKFRTTGSDMNSETTSS
ncbi:G-protein coupled receptor 83-like [Oppia nitens]|uniref:G-protein coupled receptor 83-like n=1 Tax=Oppia nitens TaxID=1686743 RepID=UPI0023D9D9D0|nr:G-protein coupled receptor 83-like [Oppia nitens]